MNEPETSFYATSNALLAAKGSSFHWARALLNARHARRATRLYGFCRRLDDAVDEAESATAARDILARVRAAIEAPAATHEPKSATQNTWLDDSMQLLQECSIDPHIPLALIHGVEGDLEQVSITDDAELLRYCYRVAGTVGLMMSAALDVRARAALPHAIDLGIAMQLTNICRDVCEDARMNRRYLPATRVGTLAPEQLVSPAPEIQPQLRATVLALLDMADEYYTSGERGLSYLPFGARTSMLVAGRIYRAIGTQLRARGGDCWSSRAYVPRGQKAMITLAALAGVLFTPSFWRPTRAHQAHLHSALAGLPYTHSEQADGGV